MAEIKPETPTDVGTITLKLRLRIEAGIGDTLTDIGHADMNIPLPVTIMTVSDAHGAGALITVDTDALTSTLTAAINAFQTTTRG